ncbi:hypothetical protein Sinac_2074 [Singulisphaera acidiphila DSM 18658]|uniref:Uncharacterized protein n=1 Tax=Singulisphaera acidiphila (strain ATCC BAA-1392 / DSM 18658 / VKM B-2454 / MOB10) TaxID=886293 RepID=L0DC31_SINAD|nr:hypothetical protein Sinac_2074 [Singulisphaera acidiphila DSM 18658]
MDRPIAALVTDQDPFSLTGQDITFGISILAN